MAVNSVLHFNGNWRSYQQRILNDLDFHLRDNKLHVVAAPGAGKTTLGIEVIARIGQPALILCPTNTIKTQWRERICSSFLNEENHGMVSTDVRKPSYITIITYQALLAAFCGEEEENTEPKDEDDDLQEEEAYSITSSARFKQEKAEEIIGTLKKTKVKLLCFDEAHHLRKEWWKALTYLNEHLHPEQTLALTATPPYDADMNEWNRYQELCGEIDEVISIPELVKNGDLCPHQDFVYVTQLKKNELRFIEQYYENVQSLIRMLRNDTELLSQLSQSAFFRANDEDVERIFEAPDFYVSIASLLASTGHKVPQTFLDLFDAKQKELPTFNVKMAATFLNGLITSKEEYFVPFETQKEHYFKTAKRLELVMNNKIVFSGNTKVKRQIAGSLGKLDAIIDIVRLENDALHDKLRMVILTDRIRHDDIGCSGMGVVPIWKKLTDNFGSTISIGILCGSLIVLPAETADRLRQLLERNGITADSVAITRYGEFESFVKVTPKENARNQIVSLVTEMFNAGDITVLVGTHALLGEGWDAPSINSLILSSTVSSYMLSNQMRGRAIRIDRNNPDKVSNIWHLASYDIFNISDTETLTDDVLDDYRCYTYDLEQLFTRFKGYEAPSYHGKHEIMSGLERINSFNWDKPFINDREKEIAMKMLLMKHQRDTKALAIDRDKTRQWWNDGLYNGYSGKKKIGMKTGVQVQRYTTRCLLYTSSLYSLYTALGILSTIGLTLSSALIKYPVLFLIYIAACIVTLLARARMFLKTGTVGNVMKQIAIIILESLAHERLIKSSLKNVSIDVQDDNEGMLFVTCSNLTAEENTLFIRCLREFLDPVENPRYILIKHDTFMNFFNQTDYFAIPAVLSSNKKSADLFKRLWQTYIGECDVVYTRNAEGRRILLKARKEAFSATKRPSTKQLSKWQ